jgi:2,4-diaminopentanoate dehydrogenase
VLRVAVWETENMGATAVRSALLGALPWLAEQKPGIYDGLAVPMQSALPREVEATRWAD